MKSATLARSGANRIIVELPGVQNAAEAADAIGQTAQLTFHPVLGPGDPSRIVGLQPEDLPEAPSAAPSVPPGLSPSAVPSAAPSAAPAPSATTAGRAVPPALATQVDPSAPAAPATPAATPTASATMKAPTLPPPATMTRINAPGGGARRVGR